MRQKTFSAARRRQILDANGGICFYCGVGLHLEAQSWHTTVQGDAHNTYCHIDHLVATSAGGTHADDNLVPCCRACNSSKGNRTLEDYRVYVANNRPHARALHHLNAALKAVETPYDDVIIEAMGWHTLRLPLHIFPGEQYRASRQQGASQ